MCDGNLLWPLQLQPSASFCWKVRGTSSFSPSQYFSFPPFFSLPGCSILKLSTGSTVSGFLCSFDGVACFPQSVLRCSPVATVNSKFLHRFSTGRAWARLATHSTRAGLVFLLLLHVHSANVLGLSRAKLCEHVILCMRIMTPLLQYKQHFASARPQGHR